MTNDTIHVVSFNQLATWMADPQQMDHRLTRRLGPFHVMAAEDFDPTTVGRWQRVLSYQGQWLLLVDQFRGDAKGKFALNVSLESTYGGGPLVWHVGSGDAALRLHLLGDYQVQREPHAIRLETSARQGRFLMAWTRDPSARVRTLNGWSVEIRCGGRIYDVLHANHAGLVRPLGPVTTDAHYAEVDWVAEDESHAIGRFMEARQIRWGVRGQLTTDPAVDLAWQPAT